jgi:hypothetical protein
MTLKTKTALVGGLMFWPSMLWLGYHFDWTLPFCILLIVLGIEINKMARDM